MIDEPHFASIKRLPTQSSNALCIVQCCEQIKNSHEIEELRFSENLSSSRRWHDVSAVEVLTMAFSLRFWCGKRGFYLWKHKRQDFLDFEAFHVANCYRVRNSRVQARPSSLLRTALTGDQYSPAVRDNQPPTGPNTNRPSCRNFRPQRVRFSAASKARQGTNF